ncbi:MAG: tRNA (N(6)-L-threonylcarbamoyladenosine(37)-C(2))-methylthiotransferase MtaB [Deltaproteobacteria bacterium]|nr:tRNA (N(6)-L-threonylcarbamoyladenosine(37)-C(2))-methylthiotransferase MtaB [Deltaproteobacteria bacterium]
MRKALFYTLGCRLNQSETAIMARALESRGYRLTQKNTGVDLCVINTCTVTNQSDQKCRQVIRSLQKKNPQALFAVVGCFSQMAKDDIINIGGVKLIIGNQEKLNLHRYLDQAEASEEPLVVMEPLSKDPFSIETIGQSLLTTRANLKVQDGCDFLCSFCVIPFARGRSRSRDPENIRREVLFLAEKGIKEVVLTGVNIGTYTHQEKDFYYILDLLQSVEGIKRVRISSIEPTTVGSEIFALMKDTSHKLLPYLHIPLQTPHDGILERMKRKYCYAEFLEYIEKALDEVPGIGIGSDVLTGFPGEGQEEFESVLKRLSETPLHYFHVFPYAERKGTVSERLNGKIDKRIISERVELLRLLSDKKKQVFIKGFLNRTLKVLFESTKDDQSWHGYSENYIKVEVNSAQSLQNQILPVRVLEVGNGFLKGEILN